MFWWEKRTMKLNSFQLKWIAIVTMVIDHVGAVLFPQHLIFRFIGRISFPIFCFLLVEGFFHTRNIEKYMIRLGSFAIISEIPYNLAFSRTVLDSGKQNVFFTLLLGILLMYMMEKSGNIWIKVTWVLLFSWIAVTICCDYTYKGILLVTIYYYLREKNALKTLLAGTWNFLWGNTIQYYGVLAVIPISMYNGEKGKSMKYFFYAFYPVHLLILYMVSTLIF